MCPWPNHMLDLVAGSSLPAWPVPRRQAPQPVDRTEETVPELRCPGPGPQLQGSWLRDRNPGQRPEHGGLGAMEEDRPLQRHVCRATTAGLAGGGQWARPAVEAGASAGEQSPGLRATQKGQGRRAQGDPTSARGLGLAESGQGLRDQEGTAGAAASSQDPWSQWASAGGFSSERGQLHLACPAGSGHGAESPPEPRPAEQRSQRPQPGCQAQAGTHRYLETPAGRARLATSLWRWQLGRAGLTPQAPKAPPACAEAHCPLPGP